MVNKPALPQPFKSILNKNKNNNNNKYKYNIKWYNYG